MTSKSSTTTDDPLGPIHPGEFLIEEFLRPAGLSAGALAKAVGVPRTRIERLVRCKVPITPDTALSRYWGNSPNSGSGCRIATTSRSRRSNSPTTSPPFVRAKLPEAHPARWRPGKRKVLSAL